MGKLRNLVFGFKQRKEESEKKVSLSQVIQAVERAEVRAKEFYSRASGAHMKARESIKQNREMEGKHHLKNWAYNKNMENMYLQTQLNLQKQLDVMQQTEDLRIFSQAYSSAQEWMTTQTKILDLQRLVQQQAEMKTQNRQIEMSMRAFSRQMGVQYYSSEVDSEFERIKADTSVPEKQRIGIPSPEYVDAPIEELENLEKEKEKS
ncbi:MAG: hypothetical protein ACTSUV_03705 [Candidatus Ranarchaeia archaeon]